MNSDHANFDETSLFSLASSTPDLLNDNSDLISSSSSDNLGIKRLFNFFYFDTDNSENENNSSKKKRVCIERYCEETVQKYSDHEFTIHFRIDQDAFNNLIS